MYFILSTGRSGSKSIAKLLSEVDGLICLHEPKPELILESSAYHYGDIEECQLENLLRSTRPGSINGMTYCESNQTLSLITPLLRDVFPSARYIWLIRNGLDFVASAMQKQWYSGHSAYSKKYEDSTSTQRAWVEGRIRADLCGEMGIEQWKTSTRFEKCCWYWSYINRLIEANIVSPQGENFVIHLEYMQSEFPKMVEWMGYSTHNLPDVSPSNQAKSPPYQWSLWSEFEKEIFIQQCGDQMSRYYPEWKNDEGTWQGVRYETPPKRKSTRYMNTRIKQWLRYIRARCNN